MIQQSTINHPNSQHQQLIQVLSELYMNACQRAKMISYDQEEHRKYIQIYLKESKISYKRIQYYIGFKKQDFIQDVLQVTVDMRTVLNNHHRNYKRFMKRTKKHFNGQHYKYLKSVKQTEWVNNVLKMSENQPFKWDAEVQNKFKDKVYPNCIYFMGLIKGNGVAINSKKIVSCAHVFFGDQERMMRIRCFATGNYGFGIVLVEQNGIFKTNDVGFGTIIRYEGLPLSEIQLSVPKALKFNQEFKEVACIQVGVLYIPDQQYLQTFETAQGFIQRSNYKDSEDMSLNEEMGLLIHNCYGMWGTSGSPLWNNQGNLLGIHNAWNDQGYNVSMIVHDSDDEEDQFCRVIRQYERRAVSVHALEKLYEKWKNKQVQSENEFKEPQEKRKLIQKGGKQRKK